MKTSNFPPSSDALRTDVESSARSFWDLPEAVRSRLDSLQVCREYSRGTTLFLEGQPALGAYLLLTGSVKLSTHSEDGKAIILRVAGAGEVIGLSANIADRPHETTALATTHCRVGFVKRRDFLDFLFAHHEAALNALQQLSNNYHKAHRQICSLGLSASAGDRLVQLLLQWIDGPVNGGPIRISLRHTHAEIGEMIGTSRETVTRLLADLRDRGLITLSKAELCIPDRRRLQEAIGLQRLHRIDRP